MTTTQGGESATRLLDHRDLLESLSEANVPTLLVLLVQLTGDRTWLSEELRPRRLKGLGDDDSGGLSRESQERIRAAAATAIGEHLRQGTLPPVPTPEEVVELMTFTLGEPVPEEYGPMMVMDLCDLLGVPLVPGLTAVESLGESATAPLSALVIGAGPCGIAAAVSLRAAGISFTVLEQNDDVAGTWHDNGYPGAAVDTPNHLYSFSFAPHDWSRYFAGRDELRDYLVGVVDEHGLRDHLRLRTEVVSATYDEDGQHWEVEVIDRRGATELLRCDVLISAVGALNTPQVPDLPGLSSFAGPTFHTARWPEGLDLSGRRIGVIGTGASAMQLVPAIVDEAESVTVFQRSPQWAAPFEKFRVEVAPALRRVLVEVPLYRAWYRLRQGWIFNDKVHQSLQKDPGWPHPDRSINQVNDAHREYFTRYILGEIGDRDDLVDAVVPTYPPFGKRMLLDNGWFRAMTREDVALETGSIDHVAGDRVVMDSGVEHRLDLLVMATGFDATHFLQTVEVRGRSGRTLAEVWDGDDAKAYLGITVPGFPNLFTLNGPNTMTGHGGSLMYLVECQLRHVMSALEQMRRHGIGAVECREDVFETYNTAVDDAHSRMIWTHEGMSTYYRNSRGRVVVNSPWRVVDFWRMTATADLDDYVTERRHP